MRATRAARGTARRWTKVGKLSLGHGILRVSPDWALTVKTSQRVLGICIVLNLAPPSLGHAQGRPVELGMDGAVSWSFVDDVGGVASNTVQTWAFPVQRLRMGVLLAERFQVQSTLAFAVADFGEISTVRFTVGLAGSYQLTGNGPRSGLFVSGGGALNLLSQNGSDAQWTVGGGLGYRVPLGGRLALRPALEIGRSFASGLRLGNTTVSGLVGLSFFTR